MSNVTERVIARVEAAICVGAPAESIVDFLAAEGIVGYDAFLAFKAAEVSLRMRERVYVEAK
jgi:hypothetical protein